MPILQTLIIFFNDSDYLSCRSYHLGIAMTPAIITLFLGKVKKTSIEFLKNMQVLRKHDVKIVRYLVR